MTTKMMRWIGSMRLVLMAAICCWSVGLTQAEPPRAGEQAPDFELKSITGKTVRLSAVAAGKKVVLVVLRGWPGYQCPLCTQQVHDLVKGAAELKKRNVQMLFVYPGPAESLQAHAGEFLQNKDWPREFLFTLDPEYTMVNAYDLRWAEKNETAYPSTFIIDPAKKILFAHVSKEHGGRVGTKDLIEQLDAKM